jgi:hypothetical protein|nr:MAG: hypothetical protein [Caudoviricetes sp.]
MNERIKELAKEARLLTGWTVGECEYQKFAELIVNECVDLILKSEEDVFDEEDPNNPYYQGMIRGKLDDCHLLKDTFGIE